MGKAPMVVAMSMIFLLSGETQVEQKRCMQDNEEVSDPTWKKKAEINSVHRKLATEAIVHVSYLDLK